MEWLHSKVELISVVRVWWRLYYDRYANERCSMIYADISHSTDTGVLVSLGMKEISRVLNAFCLDMDIQFTNFDDFEHSEQELLNMLLSLSPKGGHQG